MSRAVLILVLVGIVWAMPSLAATLETVAGNGSSANNGDSGLATEIAVKDPFGVEMDRLGQLYVTEVGHHRIRRVDLRKNRIATAVGTGARGYAGDSGPARKAELNEPYEVRFDRQGNAYFVEMQNHVIRKVDTKAMISTLAGTGKPGFGGDGGQATQATFRRPHSIALDLAGNLYIADIGNHRIRRIDLRSGIISTIAGTGEKQLPVDGQMAKGNAILGPRALYIVDGTMWIALREGNSVWKMSLQTGRLEHVAGNGEKGFRDGPAGQAMFNGPKGIVVDAQENVFVVDTENHAIRRIDGITRQVTTVAGDGRPGSSSGDARKSQMNRPHGICLAGDGSLIVGDTLNHRVVRISDL